MDRDDKAMAFVIAMMGTLIRDAQVTTSGKMLGEVKPITMRQRIDAALQAMREVGIDVEVPK